MRNTTCTVLIGLALALGLPTVYAQGKLDGLEMDVMKADETPDAATKRLALPDEASDTARERSAFGLETANEAREGGAEFGRETAEQARDREGNVGRDVAEDARGDAGAPDDVPAPEHP